MHIICKLLNKDIKDRKLIFEIDKGNEVIQSVPVQIDNSDRLQLQLELTAALNTVITRLI